MTDTIVKRLEDFSDESDAFDARLDNEEPEATRDKLLDDVVEWLDECANHGRYFPPASTERRALRQLMSMWKIRLRDFGRQIPADVRLADYDHEAGVALTVECPYPGLDPYTEGDGAIFFGRKSLVDSQVAHLEDDQRRILLVVGASGSGKSSLALAGVLPELKRKHSQDWLFPEHFTPGVSPMRALAKSLADAVADNQAAVEIEQALEADPAAACETVAGLCGDRSPMFLVDQFEEIFTVCRSADQRARFAAVLVALSQPMPSESRCKPRLLLTLRTDYLARIENDDRLNSLHTRLVAEKNYEHVSGLDAADIRRAIAEPARRVGLRFPELLINRMATETAALSNGLPSLQFALQWLWEHRPLDAAGNPKDLITEEMVSRLHSVKEALGTVANGVYEQFNEHQKDVCRRLLLELIVLDESFEEPLRRRRREAELVAVLQKHFPRVPSDATDVIEAFVGARLVRRFGDGNDSQLEVAHEALLRHWGEFSTILDVQEVKEKLNLVKQVGREAAEWIARGQSASYLNLKGDRLQRARQHAEDGWLEEAESAAYVAACTAFENRAQTQKRSERALGVGLLVVALVAIGFAFWWSEEVDSRRRDAAAAQSLLEANEAALQANEAALEANKRMLSANLTAYSSIASTLPPWDDLDVAYTLASKLGPQFRFALARALERMEDTTLVGDQRGLKLLPNDDGSALLQFQRLSTAENALRVFVLSRTQQASATPVTINLESRIDRLATAKVGPAIDGGNQRLALLAFRAGDSGPGFSVETYLLPGATQGEVMTPVDVTLIDNAVNVSSLSFHPSGRRAVFVASLRTGETANATVTQIIDIAFDAGGRVIFSVAPVPSDRPRITAVAFMGDDLVLGHDDGSVSCPGGLYVATGNEPPQQRSPIGQLTSLPGGAALAAISINRIYEFDCASQTRRLMQSADGVQSITLVGSTRHGKSQPLLSFIDAQAHRCLAHNGSGWREQPCNAQRRIAYAVPLAITPGTAVANQLTIEDARIAAIHVHPMEALDTELRLVDGRWAGDTALRWQAPQANVGHVRSTPGELRSPWSASPSGIIEADNTVATILGAGLSRDGKHLLWLEFVGGGGEPRYSLRSTSIDALDAVREEIIGYRPDAFAIASDGTVAVASPWKRSSDARQQAELAALLVGRATLYQFASDEQPISCLGFSPGGAFLVAGTRSGKVGVWRRQAAGTDFVWEKTGEGWIQTTFDESAAAVRASESPSQQVTACDIADDGEVVVGGSEGSVVRIVLGERPQELTRRIAFRLSSAVRNVSIADSDGRRYLLALGDWQTSNCSRPALPGHALSVWDTVALRDDVYDSRSPVASVCFPNQPVLALGGIVPGIAGTAQGQAPTPAAIRLLTAAAAKEHECAGCAIGNETEEEMVARLLETAKTREKAVPLDSQTLDERYGLRF